MAGSKDAGTTILETPPYVIALLLFFFLVTTLGFEKILLLLRRCLQKRGRQGLIAAMNNMQSELMCLGLATLILLLFESDITNICLNAKLYTKTWLDHVTGCACCLARTNDVSPCYLAAKGCKSQSELEGCCSPDYQEGKPGRQVVCNEILSLPDWDGPNTTGVYIVNTKNGHVFNESRITSLLDDFSKRALQDSSDFVQNDLSLSVDNFAECDGRIETGWEECNNRNNYRPAIGPKALHQIHIFIFITAMMHIALGILLIFIASVRVRFWKRWKDREDPTMQMVQSGVDEHHEQVNAAAAAGALESQLVAKGKEENKKGAVGELQAGSSAPPALPGIFEVPRTKKWAGRSEKLQGFVPYAKELAVCFARQFTPNVVTKEEFSIMRAAFVLTHHVHSNTDFSFLDYLLAAMEEDFSHVVGLGLPMWCFIIVFVLLSSAIGWCIWVFVIISGALLLMVNTKLVWIARYVTRGGHVHRLKSGIFWLNRPWLFLPIIKFLLFFVSFAYSNAIFFASQFGRSSCFFSQTGFQGQPVPWWAIMLVNTIFMVSLSLLTLPLFSITVQMGGDFKAHLLPDAVINNKIRLQNIQSSSSKGFRRLISKAIPRERDSVKPANESPSSTPSNNTV